VGLALEKVEAKAKVEKVVAAKAAEQMAEEEKAEASLVAEGKAEVVLGVEAKAAVREGEQAEGEQVEVAMEEVALEGVALEGGVWVEEVKEGAEMVSMAKGEKAKAKREVVEKGGKVMAPEEQAREGMAEAEQAG
jgi:hypothetical protein